MEIGRKKPPFRTSDEPRALDDEEASLGWELSPRLAR